MPSDFVYEIALRLGLLMTFIQLERTPPFQRVIHKEEMWLYHNPTTDSYMPVEWLWTMVFTVPTAIILLSYMFYRNKDDAYAAFASASLIFGVNGVITDIIKLCVGRPRPDFAYRCWPNGEIPENAFQVPHSMPCTGSPAKIIEGRKSFPSGHSSFAFATFIFVFLYSAGKFRCFSRSSHLRLRSWKAVFLLACLVIPTCMAISRTCDYHHHWQDVSVGSLLGIAIAVFGYRLYYPSLTSHHCDLPLAVMHSHGYDKVDGISLELGGMNVKKI